MARYIIVKKKTGTVIKEAESEYEKNQFMKYGLYRNRKNELRINRVS